MILVDGAASEARLRVRGRGSELALPAFPLTAPLRVLLRREDTGQCWDSTFSTNLAGDPLRAFRARVD